MQAFAQERPLDAPRAQGIVGERYDGYAQVIDPNAPADVRALVEQVNAQRREVYRQRAANEGVPVEQVGRVYAAEILRAAPKGTWFLQENGERLQK